MCEPVSIGMAVAGVASGVMGAKNQAKLEGQQIDAQRRQHHEMVRQNNWANADSQMQTRDSNESTRAMLTDTNIERMNNMATLSTAINESNMKGRSVDRLQTVQNIQYDMQESDIGLNYQRDYQSIFAETIGRTESTKAAIMGAAPIPRTNKLTQALNITQAGIGGFAQGMSIKGGSADAKSGSGRKAAGVGQSTGK